MRTIVKVYEFDGTVTEYETTERNHFITYVGYKVICTSGMILVVHPQSVKKIEIYEGDEVTKTIQETRHGE